RAVRSELELVVRPAEAGAQVLRRQPEEEPDHAPPERVVLTLDLDSRPPRSPVLVIRDRDAEIDEPHPRLLIARTGRKQHGLGTREGGSMPPSRHAVSRLNRAGRAGLRRCTSGGGSSSPARPTTARTAARAGC